MLAVVLLAIASSSAAPGVKPIDPAAESVPAHFHGHDPKAVFDSYVHKQSPEKSEFETTAQYQTGVAKAAGATGDAYAFEVPSVIEYDADRQLFEVRLPVDRDRTTRGSSDMIWVLRLAQRALGTHPGGNAFGARVTVAVRQINEMAVRTPALQVAREENAAYLELPMAPDATRQAKPTLGVLLVCSPAPDEDGRLVVKDSALEEATIADPVEAHYSLMYLNCPLAAIWAYDTSSGHLYQKFSLAPR